MGLVSDSLRASGWHGASGKSIAPVFGGLSWLSAGSLLLGTSIKHQPTFEVLRPHFPSYPHLVRVFRQQGYATATLQPPVRKRAGVSVGNPYEFDRTFYLADLEYQGPRYGWGIVPDQYSLAFAHRRFVEKSDPPSFLFFETVAPHGPWTEEPPPLVEDVSVLNRPERPSNTGGTPATIPPNVSAQNLPSAGTKQTRFFRKIEYDWRVLTDYLRTQAPPNSLVVVVGDHQPSMAEGESFATPLHVLSRDEALVRRFEQYGFDSGLRPTPGSDTLHHAGVYSLLMRVITAHDRAQPGRPKTSLPPYRPQGVERAATLSGNP
jgi:hypothetical protein